MVVAAAGCALVAMVARICASSPKYTVKQPLAESLVAQADTLREGFVQRKASDEQAFDAVVAARGDKDAMQRALAGAAAVPLEGAGAALEALRLAADALELGNANLVSDIGCAAEFAYAGLLAIVAGLIVLLGQYLAVWLSAFIVGVAVAGVGYYLIQGQLAEFKHLDPTPRATIETLKQDKEWVKEQIK